jgi:oxygen-dependent protoporphyrinogen oxidase
MSWPTPFWPPPTDRMDRRPERTVAAIGGGIAGLSAAWELSGGEGPGTRVIVFEAQSGFGGKLKTATFGGRDVDLGPDAFLVRRPEAAALCAELGLTGELVAPGERRAYVWSRGRLRTLPAGLALGVPTRWGPLARSGICSPAGLVGPLRDLLRPSFGSSPDAGAPVVDRAVGDVVRRRLGRQVTELLAGPLIGGIHAGDVGTMSAAAVFPALLEADGKSGSLMRALRATMPRPGTTAAVSGITAGGSDERTGAEAPVFLAPRGGMARLVDALTGALEGRGVELRPGGPVRELTRSGDGRRWRIETENDGWDVDGVVLALPAPGAAGLVEAHDAALAGSLRSVVYSSVALITLRFEATAVGRALDGSGFLVPRGRGPEAGPLVTACTWLSAKWPELKQPGQVLLRVSVGRQGDDRHESLEDGELIDRCRAELGPMMGGLGTPTETLVTRWPLAFPQYAVGHLDRVASMEAAAGRLRTLALAGAAFHGVGIPACIGSGRRAARSVLSSLDTPQ